MIKFLYHTLMSDEELEGFIRNKLTGGCIDPRKMASSLKNEIDDRILKLDKTDSYAEKLLTKSVEYNFSAKVAQVLRKIQNEPQKN